MSQFIYFPLVALALAAFIAVGAGGNISTNGTVSLTPINSSPNCGVSIWSSGFTILSQLGCLLSSGLSSYIFPSSVVQYTNSSTTVTSCFWFPAAGNPCITSTVSGAVSTTNTVNCTTIGALIIPLGCTQTISTSTLTPITVQEGFLAIVFVLIGVAVISGFSILGSGINAATIYIIFKVMGYTIIWFLLSGLAYPLFYGAQDSIPYPYGSILYFILSLGYLIGIYQAV